MAAVLQSMLATHGPERVAFMLDRLTQWARDSRFAAAQGILSKKR